jgi:hypothetical protein
VEVHFVRVILLFFTIFLPTNLVETTPIMNSEEFYLYIQQMMANNVLGKKRKPSGVGIPMF